MEYSLQSPCICKRGPYLHKNSYHLGMLIVRYSRSHIQFNEDEMYCKQLNLENGFTDICWKEMNTFGLEVFRQAGHL